MLRRFAFGFALVSAAAGSASAQAPFFTWEGKVELDANGITDKDGTLRLAAVDRLSGDDIHLTQPYLMKLLTDEEPRVRFAAAKALGNGAATAAVPIMIEWLSDTDPKTRALAAEVLGNIGGPAATQALTRSLGDIDATVRQRAVHSLGQIGQRGTPSVVIALIPRLEDDKPEVRRETIDQLDQLGDKRAVIPLIAKFDERSPETKRRAIEAVGRLGDKSAVPALERQIRDSDDKVRTAAVVALGQLGAVDAIDLLVDQLSVTGDAYRATVATALGQIGAQPNAGKAGAEALRRLVQELGPHTALKVAAQSALRAAGAAAVPALVAHLEGKIAGDPTSAVQLLADVGDARATAALTAELERGRVALPLVLKALGATHDPNALVPVLGQLSSKDPAIRLAAMEALRPLLGRDARAGDVLVEHIDDEDLEVRILAVEYLGMLEVASATPRLIALAGRGNPARLRHAAIDALGEIAAPTATAALVDVLRDGSPELQRAAATALSYIGDRAAIAALTSLASTEHGPNRHEIVRALGATLRDHPDDAGRKQLRELVADRDPKVAVAAIQGLAAAGDPRDAAVLRPIAIDAAPERRRAALTALADLRDSGAWDILAEALAMKDDRIAGDAAWALGELAALAPRDAHVAALPDRWLALTRRAGWAAAIDATGALARALWALPAADRAALVAGGKRTALGQLAFHRSRLVRINTCSALAALGDDAAIKQLSQLLKDDPSPAVRLAAATALGRTGKATAALVAAATSDRDPAVRKAATDAQPGLPPPPAATPKDPWALFYVVDPATDDAISRQGPFFVHRPDGIVWATYTDARGMLAAEHRPAGDADKWPVWPASREAEY